MGFRAAGEAQGPCCYKRIGEPAAMKTNEIRQDKVSLLDVNVLIALIDPAQSVGDLPDY
jgi:hypothetical protein